VQDKFMEWLSVKKLSVFVVLIVTILWVTNY